MNTKLSNNKRIAKNTIYLYIRMLIVLVIGLYTVRAVLDKLGVVDYGIYNVVGGVVSFFAFFNRTLSTSSQRYFSIEIAKEDIKSLNRWFSLNITTFFVIGIAIVIILETVGLWFLNQKLIIPDNRILAANVVYQLSIISFLLQIMCIPYMALIIAHEKMNVFAYIGVIEALGRLGIVFLLTFNFIDTLVLYGILILLLTCCISLSYVIYCYRHYSESKYKWYWNLDEAKNLLSFSGWHFMGTLSTACRSQGINILINMFFNPSVNAARAIAFQVNSHIGQLSSNFFTAVKPQIYKTYSAGELEEMHKLVMRGVVISSFLVSIIAYPFLTGTELILSWWLKEVPENAILFTQLAMINGIVDAVNGPLIAASLSTGKIKKFMIIVSSVTLLNLPISYIALYLGCSASITFYVSISLSMLNVLVMGCLLKDMIHFPTKVFLLQFSKITVVSVLLLVITRMLNVGNLTNFIINSMILLILLFLFYYLIISKHERLLIKQLLANKIKKIYDR